MVVMLAPVEIEVELLSLPEAAELLSLSHVQFWRLVHAGKISVVQVGTTARGKKVVYGVRREAVDALREERGPKPRPPQP